MNRFGATAVEFGFVALPFFALVYMGLPPDWPAPSVRASEATQPLDIRGLPWSLLLTPGWRAFDALGRLGHIVFGAAILGFGLAYLQPPRMVMFPLVLAFVLGGVIAGISGAVCALARNASQSVRVLTKWNSSPG